MKILSFSRKAILRAIHAACVALLLAAAQTAHAQTATGDGNGNVTITGSGTTPFTLGPSSSPPLAAGGTLTIAAGASTSTSVFSPGSIQIQVNTVGTTTNSGEVESVNPGSGSGTAIGLDYTSVSTAGNVTVQNNISGTISASAYSVPPSAPVGTVSGISVQNVTHGSISITNNGSIEATGIFVNGLPGYAPIISGIYANDTYASSTITLANTGTISASYGDTNSAYGAYLTTSGSGGITVTNSSSGSITAQAGLSGTSAGFDLISSGSGAISATNAGTITSQNGGNAYGILTDASGMGTTTVSNTGTLTIQADGQGAGISSTSAGGIITVTNSGNITVSSGSTSASGIYTSGSGAATITNSGYAGGTNTSNGTGYGIDAANTGAITITNTGTAMGTTVGIYSNHAATINNSGLASGGLYSIEVPTGSAVTLSGSSPLSGVLKGGADASSTSSLTFRIVITGNLAAAKTTLNAAIESYDTAYNAAGGNGTVESSVVVLNGIDYQWENFGDVTDDLTGLVSRLYRNTPGFYDEGLVLDTLPSGNAVASRLLNALNNVPDSGVAAALAELSPKELQVFRNVAFDNNTFNDEQINNHLANLRDGLTGFDSSALTVQDSSMDPTLNQVRDHLLAYNPAATPGLISDSADSFLGAFDAKDMKSAQVNTQPVDRWSTFIAGNVILADLSNNLNVPDSNYTTGNVSAGLDYRLDDHFTVGALFAYAHTDADLDARNSSATVDSYSPGIYASYVDGPWYGNFLGAYTRNAYTEDREIDITGLNGDNHGATSGNQGSANLTGGYEFQQGAFKFGPVASLEYVHLSIDSIQEQGPTALDINDQNQDSLRSLLGFEGRFNARVGAVSLTPHVSASWQHEYMDNSGGITSQFDGAGGGSFSTQTDNPDRDSAFIDAGLDATVCQNVTVFVDYETQAGENTYFAQSAQGGVKIGF